MKFLKPLNEIVYLFKTGFKDYSFIAKRIAQNGLGHGQFDIKLKDMNTISISCQNTGKLEDLKFKLSIIYASFEPDEDDFNNIVRDLVYVLNKNMLGFVFSVTKISFDQFLEKSANISVNKICSMPDMEAVVQSTKISNKKIKTSGDLDHIIYQTK